jgi:ribosomal protein L12E/L44/L45/RPP1/RPP2
MNKIFNAAGVKVDDYWPFIFSKLAKEFNLEELIGFGKIEKTLPEIQNKNIVSREISENDKIKSDVSKESEEDLGFGLFD